MANLAAFLKLLSFLAVVFFTAFFGLLAFLAGKAYLANLAAFLKLLSMAVGFFTAFLDS